MLNAELKLLDNGRWARIPTADEIARAVVAAARELGVPPRAVVRGLGRWVSNKDSRNQARQEIKRARFYAALALREAFPDMPKVVIGRALGVGAAKTYLRNTEVARDAGRFDRWWSDDAFRRIVEAARGSK